MIRRPPRSTLFPSTPLSRSAAFLVSLGLTLVLASADGARGAAVATICGEFTLAVGSLIALVRRHPELRPPYGIVLKVLRSEEHTSELQSQSNLVCRLLLEKK